MEKKYYVEKKVEMGGYMASKRGYLPEIYGK